MKVNAIIISHSEPKSGVSQKTGNTWYSQELVVRWQSENMNGTFSESTVIRVNKELNIDLIDDAIKKGRLIEVTFYHDTNQWNSKFYCENNGYLPKHFYKQ